MRAYDWARGTTGIPFYMRAYNWTKGTTGIPSFNAV